MFNFRQLMRQVLIDEPTMIQWCQEKNLIARTKVCEVCGRNMNLRIRNLRRITWRCCAANPTKHDLERSALEGSWFSTSKFGMEKILTFTYLFSAGHTNNDTLVKETSDEDIKTSSETVSAWLSYCREVCFIWVDQHFQAKGIQGLMRVEVVSRQSNRAYDWQAPRGLIGGPGVTVEIDEAKLESTKYTEGEKEEGCFLIGMIECEPGGLKHAKFKVELCHETIQDASTSIPLIQKHLAPGTIIVTDLWRAHFGLVGQGCYQLIVNKNQEFVNPQAGARVQTVDSSWRHFKNSLPSRVRHGNVGGHLVEYLYRKEVRLRNQDPFLHFIQCIATVYPPMP